MKLTIQHTEFQNPLLLFLFPAVMIPLLLSNQNIVPVGAEIGINMVLSVIRQIVGVV